MTDKQPGTLNEHRSNIQYGTKNSDRKPVIVATIAAIALAVAAGLVYNSSSDKSETPTTTKVAK